MTKLGRNLDLHYGINFTKFYLIPMHVKNLIFIYNCKFKIVKDV